jgi:adenylate cyclase
LGYDDLVPADSKKEAASAKTVRVGAIAAGAIAAGAIAVRRRKPSRKSGREIERKWILPATPQLDGRVSESIRQGYLFSGASEMRVRRTENACFMTVKRAGDGYRQEWESEIPEWVFDAIWPNTKGSRLRKTRYSWKDDRVRFEVDIYEGKLAGLMVLEVEFRSKRAAAAFQLPDWAAGAREVTEDARFSNAALASAGPKKLKRLFERETSVSLPADAPPDTLSS